MKQYRNPPDVHPPVAGYTHQIEITGAERLLVLSGQIGRNLDGSVPEDSLEQLRVAFENLRRNLPLADMDFSDIVKLTLYLVGDMDLRQRGEVIASSLGEHAPCMTLVYVAALASPAYRVELDAWASRA